MCSLNQLNRKLLKCRLCPRLVEWREEVGRVRKAMFRDQTYWARPVPGFGDPRARVVVLGLAPGAHGSNRTGRMFTGDGSGDFLFPALHATGFASRPEATSRDDGLTLKDLYITSAARCAPPGNKPTPAELSTCGREFFDPELRLLDRARVYLALGKVAMDAYVAYLKRNGTDWRPRPKFAHESKCRTPDGHWLLTSYHPSRQNTNTGKLTAPMLRSVFRLARKLASA